MATRDDILESARSWVGVPWRHQGRSRDHGVDCLGLLCVVAWSLGLSEADPQGYPRRPDGTFLNQFREHLVVKLPRLRVPGDVLVFVESGHPCHCGIMSTYYDQPGVIHAHAGTRKVIEQTLDSARPTIGRPVMVFSFPDVED